MTSRVEVPTPSRPTRRLALREVVVPFLVSRAVSDLLILLMATTRTFLAPAYYAGFAKWDGSWYAQIARTGYGPEPVPGQESAWPFFPLLPAVMRAVHWPGPSVELAGVLVNHAAFLLALAGLFRIARRHVSDRAATLAVWAIALFPASFLFSMIYPSAIFLAASVWAFALVEDHRDAVAGIVTVAAVMVRPNGFVVAIALAFAVGWAPRRVAVACGPAAIAFGAWCAYNLERTGNLFTFYRAKSGWPEIDVVDFVLRDRKIVLPHLALALLAVIAVALLWRMLPRSWLVLTALYLAPAFVVGMVGLGRYAGEVFPPFVAAGEILHRWGRAAVIAVLAASVATQALCVYWVVHQDWLP